MKSKIYRVQHQFFIKHKFEQHQFFIKHKNDFMKNFIDDQKLWEIVDKEIQNFLKQPSTHFLIERAKNEKWFGSLHCNRDSRGLLGYLRNNYLIQLKLLNNLSNRVPVFIRDESIQKWFASDYFKKRVLNNPSQQVILNLYKEEHLEIIKKKELKLFSY